LLLLSQPIKKKRLPLNVVGPQVRKFRARKQWSQDKLALKMQLAGWDLSRNAVTRLENQQRRVPDLELFVLARVLGTSTDSFFPRAIRGKLARLWSAYHTKLSRGQVPPA
jgi:transcriptional regulator with XRE-family HTH domain